MTSLDDSIISRQNLMLLDNVTNYKRASLDYFHHNFDYDNLEMSSTWGLLLKMRKHKLLRLPSCSSEDDDDYAVYLKRLHHCLWRRWSMHEYKLDQKKLNPLSIDWNKEADVTVLYGPDLNSDLNNSQESATCSTSVVEEVQSISSSKSDTNIAYDYNSDTDIYSSSVESQDSSIFDSPSILKSGKGTLSTKKTLKFNYVVNRRDIDPNGKFFETNVRINDNDLYSHPMASRLHGNYRCDDKHQQVSSYYNSIVQSQVYYEQDYSDYDYNFDNDDSFKHNTHQHHHNNNNDNRNPLQA